ncbi:MAG: glycoside hydrolase family 9 protein, partial [Bacteroidales bacterium]|nr:glycoside hydrolase family 9 protein [Bacteroidales bacterium]
DLNWQVSGIGKMNYTEERAYKGKRSLRFSTSLRDEEHYRQNRTEWGSFGGNQGGYSKVELKFDEPQDWSGFNRISFWVYVHKTSMPTYALFLVLTCKDAVMNATTYNNDAHFVLDLNPGEWNHVMYEIPHLRRDKITGFEIVQMLRGHNPEEEGIVTYDIDQLEIQKVDADMYEGWEVAEGKIAFSHIGYATDEQKIAYATEGAGEKFHLLDENNNIVYTKDVQKIENSQGSFSVFNFTDFNEKGEYRIRCGNIESGFFPVNDEIWIQPVFKALNFFWCQRCGFHVPGVHLECHKDWQGFHGETNKIINGGWHDAGDLSQGFSRTAMSVFSMMMQLEVLERQSEYDELSDRLREEIVWGLEWLLRTRFEDGYHMSWSVMRIYTDNKVGTIDDVLAPARNVPWENFLSAAVHCKAAKILEKSNPELALESRVAAIEDWQYAVASHEIWDHADYRQAAWGATSSILMNKLTGEDKYNKKAVEFGTLLVQCQEQGFVEGIPITGYFYTDTERKQILRHRHHAFEEAPLIALGMLCREMPEHKNWMDWYSAAVLHSEYFLKRGSRIAEPYGLLPNSVWKRSELLAEKNEDVRKDLMRQFNDGTFLNDEYVLRTFPIYHDALFHGSTNIQMSSTWALAEASRLRKDSAGLQLVAKQFRWIFGANPFSQSLMYGVGYDFSPLFAYCLKDLVGALPVGMDCMSGDNPHWSASNKATFKEIWVEPVNRFLGALAVYLSENKTFNTGKDAVSELQLNVESRKVGDDKIKLLISVSGHGEHTLLFKTFNVQACIEKQQVSLSNGSPEELEIELSIADFNKPYIVLIMDDQDTELRKEVVGTMVDY